MLLPILLLSAAGFTVLTRLGASALRGAWIERYGDSAAGGMSVVTGVVVALAGW